MKQETTLQKQNRGKPLVDSGVIIRVKDFFRPLTMPLPELEAYHRAQRKKRFTQGKKLKNIHVRELCYPVFRLFLSVDRLCRKQVVTVLNPPPKRKGRAIFACTHIFENDLENIYEKLGGGCWWFVGDPRFMYRDLSGLFVYLNGVIFLDTDDKGAINLRGLHEGIFYLEEINTKSGYNKLDTPVQIQIKAEYEEDTTDGYKTTVTYEVDGMDQGASSTVGVRNSKGSTLPSTGGIGTTIFYIVGAILVVGAGVILITKKRMANEK